MGYECLKLYLHFYTRPEYTVLIKAQRQFKFALIYENAYNSGYKRTKAVLRSLVKYKC